MREIFTDTSFLVAFYNQRDKNYKNARNITKSLEGENALWIISDYIFDEFLTVLLIRRNKQFAVEIGQALFNDPDINIIKVNEDIFDDAWMIFSKNKRINWSFTDSASYILIKKLKIVEAASFDKYFLEFGIKILK